MKALFIWIGVTIAETIVVYYVVMWWVTRKIKKIKEIKP